MRSRRGFGAWAALAAVTAIGFLMVAAMSARTNDLSFEERTLCRVRARWAAESAIAHGRATGAASLEGKLDDVTTYRFSSARSGAHRKLEGTGTCKMEHASEVTIRALEGANGSLLEWREQ
jgi:hypothetical protein